MKRKIIGIMIVLSLLFSVFSFAGCEEESNYEEILKQFDLSDPKEYLEILDEEFILNRVNIGLKKTSSYPILKPNDFKIPNVNRVEYIFEKPSEDRLDDENYVKNFRQLARIYLSKPGRNEVLKAIEQLEKVEFVRWAEPAYTFAIGH